MFERESSEGLHCSVVPMGRLLVRLCDKLFFIARLGGIPSMQCVSIFAAAKNNLTVVSFAFELYELQHTGFLANPGTIEVISDARSFEQSSQTIPFRGGSLWASLIVVVAATSNLACLHSYG